MIALMVASACIGRFESKPDLTGVWHTDWQRRAGIDASFLPDSPAEPGLHVLVFNIHDRSLPLKNVLSDHNALSVIIYPPPGPESQN
jgi:hypothetical protein